MEWEVELLHMFVSDGHNYVGRHGKGSMDYQIEDAPLIECVAGRGIRGDRYFDHKENFKGQITFFDYGVYEAVKKEFGVADLAPSVFRTFGRPSFRLPLFHLPSSTRRFFSSRFRLARPRPSFS